MGTRTVGTICPIIGSTLKGTYLKSWGEVTSGKKQQQQENEKTFSRFFEDYGRGKGWAGVNTLPPSFISHTRKTRIHQDLSLWWSRGPTQTRPKPMPNDDLHSHYLKTYKLSESLTPSQGMYLLTSKKSGGKGWDTKSNSNIRSVLRDSTLFRHDKFTRNSSERKEEKESR